MHAEAITLALGGKWRGRYGSARCPAHKDRRPSLSLANGADGRLLAFCHARCGFDAILDALRGLGLIDGSAANPPSREDLDRLRAEEAAFAAKQSARARALWGETVPIAGTVGEIYLRNRGITCPLPDTLRFQAQGWHATACRRPMMVALVEGVADFAAHRTYLAADGSGKADIEPNKAMLGAVTGGAVRLSDGPAPLVVVEGIETGLSLLSGLLGGGPAQVWAALSAHGMARLTLPAEVGDLIIASDGDKPGREAAQALGERAHRRGWRVSMLPAPDGRDWNDELRERGA